MILDKSRTPKIPFDVSAYKVVHYAGTLGGIEILLKELDEYLAGLNDTDIVDFNDNPVHDWFPLPDNVIDESSKPSEAKLRQVINQLKTRVSMYEKAYGTEIAYGADTQDQDIPVSPLSRIEEALSDAEAGILPDSLFEQAVSANAERDAFTFVKVVKAAVERDVRMGENRLLYLSKMAGDLALGNVLRAILDQGVELYPRSQRIAAARLSHLAHSDNPTDVKRAIVLIPEFLKIKDKKGEINLRIQSTSGRLDLDLVGVLLDAYHSDSLDAEALVIAEELLGLHPNKSVVNRLYARALQKNGRIKDAMSYYRAAVLVDDADDGAAVWFGNELHNRARRREAVEAYALACRLDSADAENFSHLMEELSILLVETDLSARESSEAVANDIFTLDTVLMAYRCAVSCPEVDDRTLERVSRVLRRLEISPPEDPNGKLRREQRLEFAQTIYSSLKSALTTKGAAYEFEVAEN